MMNDLGCKLTVWRANFPATVWSMISVMVHLFLVYPDHTVSLCSSGCVEKIYVFGRAVIREDTDRSSEGHANR